MRIYICSPLPLIKKITTHVCPDCKRRSRFIEFFYEWYGWDITCLRCGREFKDGVWINLPFKRQARTDSINNAKAKYRKIGLTGEWCSHG